LVSIVGIPIGGYAGSMERFFDVLLIIAADSDESGMLMMIALLIILAFRLIG
jgi:hypothetical protein